jgi:hypothetical protein
MSRDVSLFEQLDQYEYDQALLKPILKEAREDRDEIKRLRAVIKAAHGALTRSSLTADERVYDAVAALSREL